MTATRDALFPKVQGNIEAAQEKQKKQFLKRKGSFDCTFQNGDALLRRNMLSSKDEKGAQNGRPVDWPIYCRRD